MNAYHYLLKQRICSIQITPHNRLSHSIYPLNQLFRIGGLDMKYFLCSNKFEGIYSKVCFKDTTVGGDDVFADNTSIGFVFWFTGGDERMS